MIWNKIDNQKDIPQGIKLLVWIKPKNGNNGYSDMGMYMFSKWSLVTNKHMTNNVTHWSNIDMLHFPKDF